NDNDIGFDDDAQRSAGLGRRRRRFRRRRKIGADEIQCLALHLSRAGRAVAGGRAIFESELAPSLRDLAVRSRADEQFLAQEPGRIEAAFKRCRKISAALNLLRRMSLSQPIEPQGSHSSHQESPNVESPSTEEQRRVLLRCIESIVPDHQARMSSIRASEDSQERRRRLASSATAAAAGRPGGGFPRSLSAGAAVAESSSSESTSTGTGDSGGRRAGRNSMQQQQQPTRCHSGGCQSGRSQQHQQPPMRPQVAFSDTVKVDDGREVIRLNCKDDFAGQGGCVSRRSSGHSAGYKSYNGGGA
uniref:Rubis-subs-bind domain-containing protein n=1 Tax=Macrostomum lignano TaxID=282301 RepID=A0A1I8FVW1_9PLAT